MSFACFAASGPLRARKIKGFEDVEDEMRTLLRVRACASALSPFPEIASEPIMPPQPQQRRRPHDPAAATLAAFKGEKPTPERIARGDVEVIDLGGLDKARKGERAARGSAEHL